MKTSDDPLERLAAADPLPDSERLSPDERREADALLARLVSQPVKRRRRSRRVRPVAAIAAAAACAFALLLAAVEVFDDDVSGPDVVARAVAAVTEDDAIFHIVVRVGVDTPKGMRDAGISESWHAPDGAMHQKFFAVRDGRPGRLAGEQAGRLTERRTGRLTGPVDIWNSDDNTILRTRFARIPRPEAPMIDPAVDPGVTLRQLERQGDLRLAGTTRVDGREAYRLVSGPVPAVGSKAVERYEYLVDAETYYPLSERMVTRWDGRRIEWVSRYLRYETLPFDARHRRLLQLEPHPGARILYGAGRQRDAQP